MIELIETENSVYEVDHDQRKIRRLAGDGDATRLCGEDGEWKPYAHLAFPTFGDGHETRMVIEWGQTITSSVLARKEVK